MSANPPRKDYDPRQGEWIGKPRVYRIFTQPTDPLSMSHGDPPFARARAGTSQSHRPPMQLIMARKASAANQQQRQVLVNEFQEYAQTHDYPNQAWWLYSHMDDPIEKARYKSIAENYYIQQNWWEGLTPQEQLEASMMASPKLRTEENLALLKPIYEAEAARMASEYFYKTLGHPELGGKYATFDLAGRTVESIKEIDSKLQVTFKTQEPMVYVPTSLFGLKIGTYNPQTGVYSERIAPNTFVPTVPSLTGGASIHEMQAVLGMTAIETMILAGQVAGWGIGRVQTFLSNRKIERALEAKWFGTKDLASTSESEFTYTRIMANDKIWTKGSFTSGAEKASKVEPWFTVTRGTPQTPMSETLARATKGTMLSDYMGGYPEVVLMQSTKTLAQSIPNILPKLSRYPQIPSLEFMMPIMPFDQQILNGQRQSAMSVSALEQPQRLKVSEFAFAKPDIGISLAKETKDVRARVFAGMSLKEMPSARTILAQTMNLTVTPLTRLKAMSTSALALDLEANTMMEQAETFVQAQAVIQAQSLKQMQTQMQNQAQVLTQKQRSEYRFDYPMEGLQKRKGKKQKAIRIGWQKLYYPMATPEKLLGWKKK